MASTAVAIVFAGCVIIVTAGVVWFHIVRPILEDYGVIRAPDSVNHSAPIMSPPQPQTKPNQHTNDAHTRANEALCAPSSEAPQSELDRTRQTVIDYLILHGWTITDMRREKILRGDDAAISAEIADARKRLGLEPSEGYKTPIAGRPTSAAFTEPDLAYQPPPR